MDWVQQPNLTDNVGDTDSYTSCYIKICAKCTVCLMDLCFPDR